MFRGRPHHPEPIGDEFFKNFCKVFLFGTKQNQYCDDYNVMLHVLGYFICYIKIIYMLHIKAWPPA